MSTTQTRPAPVTSAEQDGIDLSRALDRLVYAYQFRDRRSACYHGLSINECYALQAIIREKGLTQNELAAELRLDKSTTSRTIDGLEKSRYVTREADPCDRRAYRLRPSEKGRRLHARIQSELVQRHLPLIDDLPADVRRAVVLVLSRIADDATRRFRGGD